MTSFKNFIGEMTIKAGNLDSHMKEKVFDYYSSKIKDPELKHVGDLEKIKVMRKIYPRSWIDFLVHGDSRIGICVANIFATSIGEVVEVQDIYVDPEHQRQDLGYKYFYFLKNVLHQKVLLGSVHSTATQEFLKKQHNLKRFDLKWFNIKSGELVPFDDDKYSVEKVSDWRVLIESDDSSTFEQFYTSPEDGLSLMEKGEFYHSLRNHWDWLFGVLDEKST